MNVWSKIMTATRAGYTAFREVYMHGEFPDSADWDDAVGRWLRYSILWANYDNTVYRNNVHRFANLYKATHGMYSFSRRLFGVPYRLGDFWQSYLWGGRLDVAGGLVGDGGALPVVTANDDLRSYIADIWKWSRWAIKKDIVPLWGSVLGDAFLRVRDDVEREKVYLELTHPGTIWSVEKDPFGNVKGYVLIETRQDAKGKDAEYKEVAGRDQGRLFYSTYRDGKLYDWREYEDGVAHIGAEWVMDYDFVPMVHVKHFDAGFKFGVGEVSQALEKLREVDDSTSLRSDQVRKAINPKWLFAGVDKPRGGTLSFTRSANTDARPEAAREDELALYGEVGAEAKALVAPLDIAGAIEHVKQILDAIEDDYPELKFERLRRGGNWTGTAIRLARQPTTTKVEQIRATYDDALVRAQQMALAIGGMRGYFDKLDLESYGRGDLDHLIGERAVFAPDLIEVAEADRAFWEAAKAAGDAGYSLELHLEDKGWSQEKIARYLASEEYQARLKARQVATTMLGESGVE